MKYIKEYNDFKYYSFIYENVINLNDAWITAIGDFAIDYVNKAINNPIHGKTLINKDWMIKAYKEFCKKNKLYGSVDKTDETEDDIKKNAEEHAKDVVKNIKDDEKRDARYQKEYDKYVEDRKKEKESGDTISFEEFEKTVNDRFKKEKILEIRRKLSTLLLAISIGLIIIGGIGGAIMSLRAIIVAHEKRKNKKKTGSDKLTEKQEDILYKILVISKVMVIIGGIGGALRSFKFLMKTKHDYTGFEDDHGFMGDIDPRDHKNESIDYEKLNNTVFEITKKSKIFTTILDKLGMIKGLNSIMDTFFQNASGLDEDLIINVVKMNNYFSRYLTNPEQKEIRKLGSFAIATIHEDEKYDYSGRLNEASDKDIENMYNMAISMIGQEKIDNIVEKVWDKNIENSIKLLEKIKDENQLSLKVSELKKTIDMKLDYHEKQELIKLGEKLL